MSTRRAYIKQSDRPTAYDEAQDVSNNVIDTLQQNQIDQSLGRLTSAENRLSNVESTRATITALNSAVADLQSYATTKANTAQVNAATYTDAAKADALFILRDELDDAVVDLSGRIVAKGVEVLAGAHVYADARLVDAQNYAASKKAEAIADAGLYTNLKHGQAVAHADDLDDALRADALGWVATAKTEAIASANIHADSAVAVAKTELEAYADVVGNNAILNSHSYTDAAKAATLVIVDNKKQEAVETAEDYTDLKKTEALTYVDEREVIVRGDVSGQISSTANAVRGVCEAYTNVSVATARVDLEAYAVARKNEALIYTDTKKAEALAYADAKKAETVAYVNTREGVIRSDVSGQINVKAQETFASAVSSANNFTNTKVAQGVSQAAVYTDSKVATLDTDISGRLWKVLSWIDAVRQGIFISQADGETEFDYSVFGPAFGASTSSPPAPTGPPITIVGVRGYWDASNNKDVYQIAYTNTGAAAVYDLRYAAVPNGAPMTVDQLVVSAMFQNTTSPLVLTFPGLYLNGSPFAYRVGTAAAPLSATFSLTTPYGTNGPYGQGYFSYGDTTLFT
jgi:hypothetical protein